MTAPTASMEPRGIAAAMSQPVFSTRTGESALGAADRATRRWAPESAEDQPRSMRSLSFVDRTVSPWVTTSQRSAGLRMFSQYASSSAGERTVDGVSWVFPRPWYQDELDWIAASRASSSGSGRSTIFTTRGTYAQAGAQAPAQSASERSLPAALYEYVAPSFASGESRSFSAAQGAGPSSAYSPLVSQSSYSAASIVAQSMRAIQAAGAMVRGVPSAAPASAADLGFDAAAGAAAPGSSAASVASGESAARSLASFSSLAPLVSALIPESHGYASRAGQASPSAVSLRAPALVTPPAPRGDADSSATRPVSRPVDEHAAQEARSRAAEQSRVMAQLFAQERERLHVSQREQARQREQAASLLGTELGTDAQRQGGQGAQGAFGAPAAQELARETARLEAVREAVRIEAARGEGAREGRSRVQSSARQQARIDAIVAERMAQLEPTSAGASSASAEPAALDAGEQQTLVQALRFAELMAHTAAIGPSALAPAAGPRLALPTGLGGLVAAVNTASAIERERTSPMFAMAPREPMLPMPQAMPVAALTPPSRAFSFQSVFPSAFTPAFASAQGPISAAGEAGPDTSGARHTAAPAESALGAIAAQRPAALAHIAWSDRWLGRFAGASESSLEVMNTVAMRSRLAPAQHFVAPIAAPSAVTERAAMESPTLSLIHI